MREIKCVSCQRPLNGGIDAFGPSLRELCLTCWLNDGVKVDSDDPVECLVCRGTGSVPHKCTCELCDATEEDCGDCEGTGEVSPKHRIAQQARHGRSTWAAEQEARKAEELRLAKWNERAQPAA